MWEAPDLGLDSVEAGNAVESTVEANEFGGLARLGDRNVEAVGKREIGAPVEVERTAKPACTRKHDAGQLEKWQNVVSDYRPAVLVEALQGEHRFEDDRAGCFNAKPSALDAIEVERGARRMIRVVLKQVSQKDVSVKERKRRHLSLRQPGVLVRDGLLEGSALLFDRPAYVGHT